MKIWIWRWGPAILIMSLIFFASATPGSDLPSFGLWDLAAKKGGHMVGYALLGITYFRGIRGEKPAAKAHLFLAWVLAVIYASTDEWHQSFTPGRTPSVRDVGIDTIGAGIGITASYWVEQITLKRQKS